jgi:acetoin utilization deacetylase AcuC-like enzyme
MGFCLYNNVAVAAAHALDRGARKVAVVDIDVHHGNGTQEIFYDDPRVLYVSTHQSPFYPGTGDAGEVGAGDGRGFTVNVPMEAGCTDGDYDRVTADIVLPVLESYAPDVLLVSAGYDAHQRDPLAGMRMSTEGFATAIHQLHRVALSCCGGAIALVTEGGYDLAALRACLTATISVLSEPDAAPPRSEVDATYRSDAACARARTALRPYWPHL